VPANDDECFGARSPDVSRQRQGFVSFKGVHARNPHHRRPERPKVIVHRSAESKVDDGCTMAARLERRCDIFHSERFDSEEGTKTEAIVSRNRPKEEDVHALDQRG
jgi:hypothetical protein